MNISLGGIGPMYVQGLFKSKADNLLGNWGGSTEESPKQDHRMVVR